MVIFSEGLCKIAEQYLKKGSKIYIEGQLQTRKYNDKDGVEKYSTEVVLQNFNSTLTMLDTRGGGGGGGMSDSDGQLRLAGRQLRRASPRWPAPAESAATWTTRFRSEFTHSEFERGAHAVDHVLHGERGEDDAEQARQHDVAGDAEQLADPFGGEERRQGTPPSQRR